MMFESLPLHHQLNLQLKNIFPKPPDDCNTEIKIAYLILS